MAVYTIRNSSGDVLLANTMPEAEYMYGCTPTAIGMILGYYDLYGYRGTDLSNLIEGDVDLKSRGTDGNAYNMDAFDTVLGKAIASEDYVYRFYSRGDIDVITGKKAGSFWTTSVEEELEYSFTNGGEGPDMRTDVWNCIADYLGTGQIWRGNDNLATSISQSTLEDILNYEMNINYNINGIQRLVDWRYTSMLYGLYLYVEDKGYSLDREITGTYVVDVDGGEFTFEDYRAEIDAGRPVLISIEGHSMVGYGYNQDTNEIIFDDCYQADQRMVWDGVYHYSDADLPLQSITVIGLMANSDVDLAAGPVTDEAGTYCFTADTVPFSSGDYCYVGSSVCLNFTVSNLGTAAAGAFEVSIYLDGALTKSVSVLSLDANSSGEYRDIPLDELAPGLHSVRVVVDAGNVIPEQSGANNVLEQKLMVLKEGANIVTGIKTVNGGQVSQDDYVAPGWQMHVLSDATASGTVVRGIVTDVAPNGVISFQPALAVVSQGGLIQDAAVYEYGQIQLAGTAEDLHVFEDGIVIVSSGGKLTGKFTAENGATVSMDEGAVMNFDLTKTEAGADALANDLSRVQGTPVYTLTVSDTQASGIYTLAEGAAGFTGTLTVQNTSGESLGTLAVGETIKVGDTDYTLNLGTETAADALTLTVGQNDTKAPKITLTADTETVVKQTTLTAEVDDGSEIYFRISEFGNWKKYTEPIIASLNETYYFKATDEAGNEGTNQITFGNIDTSGILLSTLWSQRGINPMGGNTTVCYDEYTPYDPSVTPDTHSLVGCVNVAVGQLIYYYIEKQGLELALTLDNSDEYTSSHKADEGDPIVIEIKSDGTTPGTLSFAEINEYLSDFKLDSAEHAAALLYACGVVHKSKYAAASTGASWKSSLFTRFGFKCVNIDGPYLGMGYYYWGYWDDDFKIHISDAGYEVLIENLEAGRSVGAAYRGHALVIDGYDRETDTFHINFGWGYNQATRWYTREGIFELQLNDFVYDLMADYVETFTVTDARLYGTGTMLRAFEQASGMVGANTVVFDSSVAGKTVELENNIKVTDETTVNGFNMNVLVTSVFTDEMPAYGVYSDKGGILSFHASGGSLIVSTSNEYTHAFNLSKATSGTVTAGNMLIYAGKSSDGAGAAAVLQALQTCRSENTEVSEDLLDANGWSYFGSAGNDVFSLSNLSIAVGNVTLGDGDDVLSLVGHSRLYGTIDVGDGDNSITVDSTSSISGDLSGKSKLKFVLTEREDHALFTIRNSVSDLYANSTISVDITDAQNGIYTLISAVPGAVGIENLQNMVFTVTGSGETLGTLNAGSRVGIGENNYKLNLEESVLKLTVQERDSIAPTISNIQVSTSEPTNQPVVITADFADNRDELESALYRIGEGGMWSAYRDGGIVVYRNTTVYFKATDQDGNESETSLAIDNIGNLVGLVIASGKSVSILNGEEFSDTVVSNGTLYVSSGGTGNGVTVHSGGKLIVSSGGTASGIVEDGGYVEVKDGGIASFAANTFSGCDLLKTSATVHSGTTATETNLRGQTKLIVSSGGIANSTTVNSSAFLFIASGGTAMEIVENGGYVSIEDGAEATFMPNYFSLGSADSVTIHSGTTARAVTIKTSGTLEVFSGGVVSSLSAGSGASLHIASGGTAMNVTWNPWENSQLNIDNGAFVTFNSRNQYSTGCYLVNYLGNNGYEDQYGRSPYRSGTILYYSVLGGDRGYVMAGGTASAIHIASWGSLGVYSGGLADSVYVTRYGKMTVSSGGVASHVVIREYEDYVDHYDGYDYDDPKDQQRPSRTIVRVANGGLVFDTDLQGGQLIVSSGGTAIRTHVERGEGINKDRYRGFYVSSGGTAIDTVLEGNGQVGFHISEGCVAISTLVCYGASMTVYSGGTAIDTIVNPLPPISSARASMTVLGGTMKRLTISSGGTVFVEGGEVNSVTVNSKGCLSFRNSGGKLTGRIICSSGGSISGVGRLDFDLTEILPGSVARVNNLSAFSAQTYTLTVNADQTEGIYVLAEGASSFSKTITVVNQAEEELGTLSVGKTVMIGKASYILNLSDGILSLQVGENPAPPPYTSNGITVDAGSVAVQSGEVFFDTLVNSGGTLHVSSGGTALKTKENGGYVDVQSGADVSFASNTLYDLVLENASATVHSGTTAVSPTVASGGDLRVYSGGVAEGIVWTPCEGVVSIGYGASATFANEYSGVYYGSGGKLLSSGSGMETAIGSDCEMYVMSGGSASASVGKDGRLSVASGGTARVFWTPGNGHLEIEGGADVKLNTPNRSGTYYESDGKSYNTSSAMNAVTLDSAEDLLVLSKGIVSCATVNRDGMLGIGDGGLVNSVTVNEGGRMVIFAGGCAISPIVSASGSLAILSGGTAAGITLYDKLLASSAGLLAATTVSSGGAMIVEAGTADYTVVSAYGHVNVTGGMVNSITVFTEGTMTVGENGTATNIMLDTDARLYVSSGGTATNLSFVSGAYLGITAGTDTYIAGTMGDEYDYGFSFEIRDGVVSNYMVDSGYLEVGSGVTAVDITVCSGGTLFISSGGKLAGRTRYIGGIISAAEGAVVNFDLIPWSTANFSDLSAIQGAPFYTITVKDGQPDGIYSLARGAESFDQAISVLSTAGEEIGTISIGESITVLDNTYTLNLSEGELILLVGENPVLPGRIYDSTTLMRNYLYVSSGEVANDTLVYYCSLNGSGGLHVLSGGLANNTTIYNHGCMYVSAGGVANGISLEEGGSLDIGSGGIVNHTTIQSNGGFVYVSDGVAANDTTINSNGNLRVMSGGVAHGVSVRSGGNLYVSSGGTATDVEVASGARMILMIDSGTYVTGHSSGTAFRGAAGILSDYAIESSYLYVLSGGTLKNAVIDSESKLVISAGGRLTGRVTIESGAIASGGKESIIDFDLSAIEPGSGALYTGLDYIRFQEGRIKTVTPIYTLTVGGQLKSGRYTLTEDKVSIPSLEVRNSFGETLGTLKSGQTLTVGKTQYAMSGLSITVSEAVNPVSEIAPQRQTWEMTDETEKFVVEYSTDSFEHVIQLEADSNSLDSFRMPAGTYQVRVRQEDSEEWTVQEPLAVEATDDGRPRYIMSNHDGNTDVFFANPVGTWETGYLAQHVGSTEDTWGGTNEYVALFGKNKLADIIEGSTDANILLMTDDENGDTLFVDDIYTALPGSVVEQQSRIAQIDEIRAGAGDDIVDMTSQRFEYIGDGLTIRGGDGNDIIWANKGDNFLFGDAGNDRIVGASGNDVIAGGIENDRMHGGGGNDIFTFCNNWGSDTVEQLATGSVTLWFASGSEANWNVETLTYTDGDNSVKVSGVAADDITLKFGTGTTQEDEAQFAALSSIGAFADFTTERIFEESGKGILASL